VASGQNLSRRFGAIGLIRTDYRRGSVLHGTVLEELYSLKTKIIQTMTTQTGAEERRAEGQSPWAVLAISLRLQLLAEDPPYCLGFTGSLHYHPAYKLGYCRENGMISQCKAFLCCACRTVTCQTYPAEQALSFYEVDSGGSLFCMLRKEGGPAAGAQEASGVPPRCLGSIWLTCGVDRTAVPDSGLHWRSAWAAWALL
jgi:hypothetical protein